MSGSNLPEFHFIELKGEITGGDRQPPIATEHRFLSLSRVSMNRLIATRDSANTGAPLPSISPPRVDEPATQASAQISALALGVDFSLPPGDGLWLMPCRQVHMFGMRYPIDVVFLDEAQRVVHLVADLDPGRLSPKVRAATSVLELPIGTIARLGLTTGARIEIEPVPSGGAA